MNYIVLFIIFILIFCLFIFFLLLLNYKILKLEKKIIYLFKEKTNQIPSIYEITKDYLNKHEEIFQEILILKKKDYSENTFYITLIEKTNIYKLIHNELDFIFRICNTNPKIEKDPKFNLIKNNILNKSSEIWDNLVLYKSIVKKYNNLIKLKNITIIWLLIPIHSIISI